MGQGCLVSSDVHETIRRRFDERAAHYDESDMHRGVADAVARFASLDGVDAVLDVATGTGLVLRALRDRLARQGAQEPRLVGVDLSPQMLMVARRELPGATLEVADAASLPLPDASVDLVTCVTALHILPDPVHHAPFASHEELGRTVSELGLSVARHEAWTNGEDSLLIAELEGA